MKQQTKKDNFIVQAGILAVAGIISRIIGLLYRSPLTLIIGDEGNGYYSYAINMYSIILLVASYSIPSAISKVVSGRLAFKEYRNAHRIFKCALLYVVVVGGIASIFTYFAAPYLVVENSVQVLRVFAPTIFFSGLCGVFRGYFQAHKTMLQTSVSQILEQILNAVVSMGAAYLLIQLVKDKDATTKAIYGAIGSALGTGAGVLVALLFMLSVYLLNRKGILHRVKKDSNPEVLSYNEILKILLMFVTPFILSTFIYNFSTTLNQTVYSKIMMNIKKMEQEDVAILYGIFSTKVVTIVNIPIAIASALSAALMPRVSAAYAKGDLALTKGNVHKAISAAMLIAIPSAVGLGALAEPVIGLLFPGQSSNSIAGPVLCALAISVAFYSLSTLTMGILQGIGKVNAPVIHAAIALALQIGVLAVTLIFTDGNLYCLALANIVYSFTMCVLNGICVRKYLNYKQEIVRTFIKPSVSAIIMGIVAWGVYTGLFYLTKSNYLSALLAICLAAVVYFIMIIKTGAVGKEELVALPKGTLLVKVAEKMHLFKGLNKK